MHVTKPTYLQKKVKLWWVWQVYTTCTRHLKISTRKVERVSTAAKKKEKKKRRCHHCSSKKTSGHQYHFVATETHPGHGIKFRDYPGHSGTLGNCAPDIQDL